MPRNIESRLSQDNTPEYRTAKGDKGLIFAEPGKTADKIANQERAAYSKELRIEDIKAGSSAMVWYNIDKDIQRQLQLIDEGKSYNKNYQKI